MDLKSIKDPSLLKNMSYKELKALALEIRSFLIEQIPKTGGHLSSNLGTIELIIALHYVFNSPKDAFIFDVGHQAYAHKILTGRMDQFDTLRQTNGLSGYISYDESEHDQWESGHAGTAISALMGFLYANKLKGQDRQGIAIVGDASMTNGMSFEALNLLGNTKDVKGIIILNDNEMSISKSVGSITKALTRFRSMRFFIKLKRFWQMVLPEFMLRFLGRIKRGLRGLLQRQNIFEDLGYMYIGPLDGHDIKGLIYNLKRIKNIKKSVVIHLITEKGKGHIEAEQDRIGTYHGVSKATSIVKEGISWSQVISDSLDQLQKHQETFVVMPAMTVGAHFMNFQSKYPDRYLDVGIAEEHAATMAASLAHQGIKVFLPLYATFAQRAFDQILNDIARSNHHVVIGIDRAGLVGEDGSTHQGLYDVSMFNVMPNVTITMPYDANEAADLLYYGFMLQKNPFVIRYPRGLVRIPEDFNAHAFKEIKPSWVKMKEGEKIALISYGPSIDLLIKADKELNLNATIINARFIKPIDSNMIKELIKTHTHLFIYEEVSNTGSLYPSILKDIQSLSQTVKTTSMSITDQIVEHGHYKDILKKYNMDLEAVKKRISEFYHET